MSKSVVGYLGLLGPLGLLGLLTGNTGFYGFFGFFGFLSALWGRGTDERVERNVDKACRNAFLFATVASAFFIASIAMFRVLEAFPLAFSVLFTGSMLMFVASFIYYDGHGD